MPFIMGLEGPRPTLLGAAHGELLAAVPRPFWRAGSKLSTLVRSAGDPRCCWNCSCESNPCCDGYTGASPSRTLRGITDSPRFLPALAFASILLGGWLAGSIRGQALVRKYKPRRK